MYSVLVRRTSYISHRKSESRAQGEAGFASDCTSIYLLQLRTHSTKQPNKRQGKAPRCAAKESILPTPSRGISPPASQSSVRMTEDVYEYGTSSTVGTRKDTYI